MLPQAARGIGGGRHGSASATSGRIGRDLYRRRIWQANARVELKMILPARGTIALAGIFVAQAGQFVAAADAIAVAGFRSCFDGNESHGAPSKPDSTMPAGSMQAGGRRAFGLFVAPRL